MIIISQIQIDDSQRDLEHVIFKVFCPGRFTDTIGQYNHFPHKLMIYNNGSVSNEVRYQDLCVEGFAVSVAYNEDWGWFEVENGTMVEYYDYYKIIHPDFYLPYDYEILSIFFKHYNIKTNWINCNYTWGSFDNETGKWTGLVGRVDIYYVLTYVFVLKSIIS